MRKVSASLAAFLILLCACASIPHSDAKPPQSNAPGPIYPLQYELLCPAGSSPISLISDGAASTFNVSTGKWRANRCTDANGNISSNFTGITAIGNVNGVLTVDGAKYLTIASAISAAGSNPTIIIIPSTYAGTECPSLVSNVTVWDYRAQGVAGPLCSQNSISVNQTSGGLQHVMLRPIMTRTSTPDSDDVIYMQAEYNGNLPNQSIEAAASEVDVVGNVTNNSNAQVIAHEFDAVLNDSSAVHAISYMSGGFVNNTLQTGNQVSPLNIYGWYIRPITNNSAVVPANVYGMWIESPASCSTNCFSFVAQGQGKFDKTLTLDNSTGLPLTILTDTTSNYGLSIVDTHTGGHTYNCGDGVDGSVGRFECRDLTQAGAPYFGFDTTGQGSGSIAIYKSVAMASRTYTFPDGAAAPVMVASLTTTAAASDNVSIQGMTASGHCTLTATNASAATNITTTFISAKAANQITVSHTATANMTYDIMCTGI